jgi:hypothetical protein
LKRPICLLGSGRQVRRNGLAHPRQNRLLKPTERADEEDERIVDR